MHTVSIEKLAKAMKTLQDGQLKVLESNNGDSVTDETLMWNEYYVKKMLLVLTDVERGKEPYDMDIDFVG